jgi:tetratricopeptide (TPR) repeat protein
VLKLATTLSLFSLPVAAAQDPAWPTPFVVRGVSRAASVLAGSSRRGDRFAEAYYHRGYMRALLGRLANAVADFGRAATIRSSTHRFAYASDQLPVIAIALAPNYPLAHDNRARLLLKQGKHEAAAADFRRVLTLTDDPDITAAVHNYLRQLGP